MTDDDVNALLRKCGYPGMKVLEFGDSRRRRLPPPRLPLVNSIAMLATHDNEPVNGWMATAAPEDITRAVLPQPDQAGGATTGA